MHDRTSIVIAHRLTTVEKCQRIVVLENGRVVEEGKLVDLEMTEGGFFVEVKKEMDKKKRKSQKKIIKQGTLKIVEKPEERKASR